LGAFLTNLLRLMITFIDAALVNANLSSRAPHVPSSSSKSRINFLQRPVRDLSSTIRD